MNDRRTDRQKLTAWVCTLAALVCWSFVRTATAEENAGFSEDQLRAVYAEMVSMSDGLEYQFDLARFDTCEAAMQLWLKAQPPRAGALMQPLRTLAATQHMRFRPLPLIPPGLRERIRILGKGDQTGVVRLSDGTCVMAQVTDLRQGQVPPYAKTRDDLPRLVAEGLLPSPAQLASDPALRQRALLNAIDSVAGLAALPRKFDFNTRLSNGQTLLTHALLLENAELAKAVLARGASANVCAPRYCPLNLALRWENEAASEQMVRDLLWAGANPNQLDVDQNALTLPLASAALARGTAIGEMLLVVGAKAHTAGLPEAHQLTPPLFHAAHKARRDWIELLLARGADPLVTDPGQGLRNRLLDAAEASQDKEFTAWLERRLVDWAKASGKYEWDGWVEQDGRRISLNQPEIRLKRRPFRILARMQDERVLVVTTSESDQLQRALTAQDTGAFIFRGGATWGAEETDGSAQGLFVNRAGLNPKETGVSQAWYWSSPADRRFTTRIRMGDAVEYSRLVSKLLVVDGTKTIDVPLQKYKRETLHLIVDCPLELSAGQSRFLYPRLVRLRFL